jgi:hypothetical protein
MRTHVLVTGGLAGGWWMKTWNQGVLIGEGGAVAVGARRGTQSGSLCPRKFIKQLLPQILGKFHKLQGPSANTLKRKIFWSATVCVELWIRPRNRAPRRARAGACRRRTSAHVSAGGAGRAGRAGDRPWAGGGG